MIGASVKGAGHVLDNLRRLRAGVDRAKREVVSRGSMIVRNKIVARLTGNKGWDPFWGPISPSGAFLGGRTGQTRQRISPGGMRATFKINGGWRAGVGSPDAHVVLHDQGGTVPGAPIPTAAAMRRSGTLRFGPREVPGGFVWPNQKQLAGGKMRATRKWIATSESGKLVLMFLLNRNPVTHRARHIFDAVQRESNPEVAQLGRALVAVEVGRANG